MAPRKLRRAPLLTGMFALSVGCAPPGERTASADADSPRDAQLPPMPLSGCHTEPHTLIDTPTGDLVSWSERDAFRLPSTTLTALLTAADVRGVGPFDFDVRLYRFRYTTQDRGEPIDSTGMVAVPVGVATRPTPVALVLHYYSGFLPGCAASEDLVRPLIPLLYAAHGYYAIAPDYIGLSSDDDLRDQVHAPLVLEQTAIAALDALRAGRTLFDEVIAPTLPTPTALREDVIMTGASLGGHGALATATLQPYYAPEWPTLAVTAAVPPTDVLEILRVAMQPGWNEATGLAFGTIIGMNRWFHPGTAPEGLFTASVLEQLDPLLSTPDLDCATRIEASMFADETDDLFHPDLLAAVRTGELDRAPGLACTLDAATPLQLSPPQASPPILLTYGGDDIVIPPSTQVDDIQRMCDAGWSVDALTCSDADHAQAGYWSFPEQFAFLEAAVEGTVDGSRCATPESARCEGQP